MDASTIRFVGKLFSGGPFDASHDLGTLLAANGFDAPPGADPRRPGPFVRLNFLLVPAHPHVVIPGPDDDPLDRAAFALGVLGDCKQGRNPIRRRLTTLGLDPFEGPDLWPHRELVAEIIGGTRAEHPTDTPTVIDRASSITYASDWEAEVDAAIAGWRGATPPYEICFSVLVEPVWATHATIPLPPFGTRAHLPGS